MKVGEKQKFLNFNKSPPFINKLQILIITYLFINVTDFQYFFKKNDY